MKQNITELQALQNALSDLPDLQVHEKHFGDRRNTLKKYFLHNETTGETISPVLDYDNLNHFILGFSRAKKLFAK